MSEANRQIMLNAAALKGALASRFEPTLEQLRAQLADRKEKLHIGQMCEVFTPEQVAGVQVDLARFEGMIEGIQMAADFVATIIDALAEEIARAEGASR